MKSSVLLRAPAVRYRVHGGRLWPIYAMVAMAGISTWLAACLVSDAFIASGAARAVLLVWSSTGLWAWMDCRRQGDGWLCWTGSVWRREDHQQVREVVVRVQWFAQRYCLLCAEGKNVAREWIFVQRSAVPHLWPDLCRALVAHAVQGTCAHVQEPVSARPEQQS